MRGLDFVSWANQSKGNDEEEKPRISKAPMKSPSTRNKAQSLPTASIWKENLKTSFIALYFLDNSIVSNISSFSLKLLQSNQWKFHYLILNFWSPHPHIFKIKPISNEAIMPKQYISNNLVTCPLPQVPPYSSPPDTSHTLYAPQHWPGVGLSSCHSPAGPCPYPVV